tara:strand:- start:67 stop:408 length:342 start_codon:yes stop_codon:yes gene_type:complete
VKTRDEKGRWKEGVSGNPKGRPIKKLCIADILKVISQEEFDTDNSKLQKVLRVVFDKAIKGDMKAIEFIAERLEGKPKIMEKTAHSRPIDSIVFIERENVTNADKEIKCYNGI